MYSKEVGVFEWKWRFSPKGAPPPTHSTSRFLSTAAEAIVRGHRFSNPWRGCYNSFPLQGSFPIISSKTFRGREGDGGRINRSKRDVKHEALRQSCPQAVPGGWRRRTSDRPTSTSAAKDTSSLVQYYSISSSARITAKNDH